MGAPGDLQIEGKDLMYRAQYTHLRNSSPRSFVIRVMCFSKAVFRIKPGKLISQEIFKYCHSMNSFDKNLIIESRDSIYEF